MRILIAVDGSPYSDRALDETVRRSWPDGSELRIMTAINPVPPVGAEMWALPPNYYEITVAAAREAAERVLAAARDRIGKLDGIAVTTEILLGPPAVAIVEEAERWKADLLVVGSHGYGNIKGFLLGSVSHAVTLHAPCTIEVVRERRRA
jgi:nucleotide-binding universal stress UspA family protein